MRVLGLITSPGAARMAVLETDGRTIEAFGPAGVGELEAFLDAHGPVDLIGVQGGDAERLARATGTAVACDFGFAGPAVYYRARVRAAELERPAAVVDGASITLVAENGLLTVGDQALAGQARSVVEASSWGEFVEAEAVAYLAARCWNGLPIAFPGTTGAPYPMPGGRIVRP